MGRKKKYPNAAARQKAFRIRHGQRKKVPVEIRRGEKLGSQEADLRQKKEGETWEQYQLYIKRAVERARYRQAGQVAPQVGAGDEEDSKGAKRSVGGYTEPIMDEEYYEIARKKEEGLRSLGKGRKMKKRRRLK